jgi:predicted Ser/Thr protein kinase
MSECRRCGAEVRPDTAEGLCPGCLLNLAMNPDGGSQAVPAAEPAGFVPPDPASLARHFPHLEIISVLGQGGMGVVYKARQRNLDRLVALKVLPPQVSHDPSFAERFSREARALARLDHPGIVGIHDFGQSDGLYYLTMQFVDGANLRQVLRAGQLSPHEALRIVPQICEALQYAHEQGLVHRDIKPENILLDRRGHIKIADFGLAKLLVRQPADVLLTASGQVMGTPHYMAPEQTERPQEVDHRADIYSLGVVFYEMLTGELPLGRFPPPSQKAPVDVRLDRVVLRTLEKEPERRYQHAGDVKTDVESISPAPKAAVWAGPAPPARGFRWKLLALVAGVYGLAFLLPAYHLYASWDNGPGDRGWLEGHGNDYGWECFRNAWTWQYPCWYANPALWAGCVLVLLRRWLWGGLVGLLALILGMTVWNPFSQSRYLAGYWVWVASMAVLAGGSLYAWWTGRRTRQEATAVPRPRGR